MYINRKTAVCIGCGREKPIYAKKLCGFCYQRATRTDALTKGKAKPILRKPTGEAVMFEEIWEKRVPHISAVSNKPISHFEYTNKICFAHVLPKKQYPNFRLTEENIEYLKWDEHTFWDNRTEEELAERIKKGEDWGYMLQKEKELKDRYRLLYPGSISAQDPTGE